MSYPVTFEADYVERRSRLTTFFRLILAIPHFIVMTLYGFAACVVVLIAWFALLFTGRWPRGMYDFVAGFLRYSTAVNGYIYLLTDAYPPFGPDVDAYPVRLNIAPPKEEYSRLKVLFRVILAIPPYLITYAMQIVAQIGALLAWFAIVVLGRQPKGLQDMIVLGLSYQQRAYAYMGLITEDWPPFTDDAARQVEPPAPAFGALPSTPPAAAGAGPEAPGVPAAPPQAPPGTPAAPPPPSAPPTPETTHGDPLGEEAERATPPPEREDDDERPPGPFGPTNP
ncbi:MAG TPA: DUF4389 domain-containing protein [Solirubrobacteraceae bacterium]